MRNVYYFFHSLFVKAHRRIHAYAVSGVDARALDMLHYARNQNVLSV